MVFFRKTLIVLTAAIALTSTTEAKQTAFHHRGHKAVHAPEETNDSATTIYKDESSITADAADTARLIHDSTEIKAWKKSNAKRRKEFLTRQKLRRSSIEILLQDIILNDDDSSATEESSSSSTDDIDDLVELILKSRRRRSSNSSSRNADKRAKMRKTYAKLRTAAFLSQFDSSEF